MNQKAFSLVWTSCFSLVLSFLFCWCKTPSIFRPPSSPVFPKDQEICFSPDEGCEDRILSFLKTAEKSIDLAAFDLTLDAVAHQLLVKSRQMPVRVILDKRQAQGRHSLATPLFKGGVPVRLGKQRGLMHHKFLLLDRKALEVGSFNYTNNASRSNQENQIYFWSEAGSQSASLVSRFQERFDRMWEEAMPFVLKKEKEAF